MIYPVKHLPREIALGVQNETGVTEIGFDVAPWLEAWPGMQVSVWHTLPGQTEAYQAECRMDGSVLYWIVSATDTQTPGTGKVELMGTTPDGTRKRLTGDGIVSRIGATTTATTQEPPEAPPTWVDTVKQMISHAAASGDFDGVGIERVYQKVTSLDDGGENIVYVVLTDGRMSSFSVRNGRQGRPGAEADYGESNAGMLLLVGDDGKARPLALGAGLQIVDGTLSVTGAPSDDAQYIFYTADGSVFRTVDDAVFYVKGD